VIKGAGKTPFARTVLGIISSALPRAHEYNYISRATEAIGSDVLVHDLKIGLRAHDLDCGGDGSSSETGEGK
jgi:hypothetical protein